MFERLRERRPRWGCMVASLALAPALACCLGTAVGAVVPPSEVDQAPGEDAFNRELGVAQAIGLVVRHHESIETEEDVHRFDVAVAAGECAAVVASAWGWIHVDSVGLGEGETELSQHTPSGMVGHTQYCATSHTTLTARIDLQHQDGLMGRAAYSGGTLRYAVLVGRPPGGISSLTRGYMTAEARGRLPATETLRRADQLAAGRASWGPVLPVASYRARLVPETAESYQHLRALAQNQDPAEMTPRIDLLPATAPAAFRPLSTAAAYPLVSGDGLSTSTPAMAFEGTTPVRVLAVVDAAALGRCVDVQLIRNVWGSETPSRRLNGSSGTRDGNVLSDRVCGARATFVTDGTDHSPYLLRLYEAR